MNGVATNVMMGREKERERERERDECADVCHGDATSSSSSPMMMVVVVVRASFVVLSHVHVAEAERYTKKNIKHTKEENVEHKKRKKNVKKSATKRGCPRSGYCGTRCHVVL